MNCLPYIFIEVGGIVNNESSDSVVITVDHLNGNTQKRITFKIPKSWDDHMTNLTHYEMDIENKVDLINFIKQMED
jgi:hypothetical protein